MSPVVIVLLSIADIVLYTIRSFTNKLFAISYDGKPSMATPIFSAITGFSGFLFTILLSGGIQLPNMTTLLCGISGGCILFLLRSGQYSGSKDRPVLHSGDYLYVRLRSASAAV